MSVSERELSIKNNYFFYYVQRLGLKTFEKFNTSSEFSESFSKISLELFEVSHTDLSC